MRVSDANRAGNRPPECSNRFLLLPEKKRGLRVSVKNESLAVYKGWKSQGAKFLEADFGEVAFLMPSKDETENLFREPSIQLAPL